MEMNRGDCSHAWIAIDDGNIKEPQTIVYEFPEEVQIVIEGYSAGNVRNLDSVRDAMYGANYVFHAAALKEVPSCEFFPMEAVRTNIIGTDNVITAAVEAGVQRVVFLSTDKAAYPINTMGMTKAVGEKVVQARAQKAFERGGTVLACTRYGNVIYDAMEGHPHRCHYEGVEAVPDEQGRYCHCPVKHKATLGRIVELLHQFHDVPNDFIIPKLENGSFEKKLFAMYLSYLPREATIFDYKMNCDQRGSFTELIRTLDHGQVSINVSKPGITKGEHWHLSKWEIFIVVHGHGLIQMRDLKSGEIEEYEVSGEKIQGVYMKPGWTHNIINLSDTEDLVTVMFASELLDKNRPDTYFEKVMKD